MQDYAYYNGIFAPYDATAIPLSDRSIFFGDAVYDVMIGRQGLPYQMGDHLDRLLGNAREIGLFELPTKESLVTVVNEVIGMSGHETFTVYVQLSSNGQRRAHLRDSGCVNVLVTVTEAMIPDAPELIDAITLEDMRHGVCNLKTTNLLLSVMSVHKAHELGAELAIFYRNGQITEASYANVAILREGKMIFHPLDSEILPGITQRNLERACQRLGITSETRKFGVSELFSSDLVITSSTTKLIKVCRRIDGVDCSLANFDTATALFEELHQDFIEQTSGKSTT